MTLRPGLGFYDVTNITVGAIVGADIYIASAITAGLLGPASLLAWAAAGVLATLVALMLAECARLVPQVGGPYAYVGQAYGRFPGFLTGWSMWIAELTALPVFAIAFTSYLAHFVTLGYLAVHAVQVGFLVAVTGINVASVRAAGRVNDALTALKLAPLLLLVVAGVGYAVLHPAVVKANLEPFAPLGFANFPAALVLIFWAYAGFELSTVPSSEVQDPQRTIPRALSAGMLIVTAFYLSTNLVVYALVDPAELAGSNARLLAVGTLLFGSVGAGIVAIGAMISVSGSDESDMLGSSRLCYAMASDGLLPHRIATVHRRFRTPYVALLIQGSVAVALTFVGKITNLISFAVFDLAFAFLMCALALLRLQGEQGLRQRPARMILPLVAVAISLGLLASTSTTDKLAGAAVLVAGTVIYFAASPGEALPEARQEWREAEVAMQHAARQRMRFLGAPIGWIRGRSSPSAGS